MIFHPPQTPDSMRIRSIFLATTAICLCLQGTVQAQGFLHASGRAIVDGSGDTVILRGMGLGGWMLQEGYMLHTASFANPQWQIRNKIESEIGPAATDSFYQAWLSNHVRKIDIDSLKAWGFNSVRLPMHYKLFTLPIEDEPVPGAHTWLSKGFELTDSLISWCRQNEMYVMLDLHGAPGGQGQDQGISDYDPSKPSLWESPANQAKTVALWKKLAERYAQEPWVAGYDLINEPNWPMQGNAPLRALYRQLTDTIRSVDTNHLIVIEGNWFANDFTGLTPPWDDNMAYGPHKYWSLNDQASIQWVLDIRNAYEVPLYFGETGENSNTWFRDAIRLFEDNDIGWAWWPMKKVEDIRGPLSVRKNPGYQALLDYWTNGGTAPSVASAKAALMQLTEDLKLEHCFYQKDVIDAMFRQPTDDATLPYVVQAIPGVVYASSFDMGRAGYAYADNDLATYHVSTGTFTAWNRGWALRNDGVDIEKTQDPLNTSGYHVGFLEVGEWMQYSVEVATTGVYRLQVRLAAGAEGGAFRLTLDGADITQQIEVPSSGGYENWQTLTVDDVVLDAGPHKLRFYVVQPGYNFGSIAFTLQGASQTLPTSIVSAFTLDKQRVQLNLNKSLAGPLPATPADFDITVNGSAVPIAAVTLHPENPRIITFAVGHTFRYTDDIRISYGGSAIVALDGTPLGTFTDAMVQNNLPPTYPVPGKVEAEGFFDQAGVQLEATSDTGGGSNVGYLDAGDYLDYYLDVGQAGIYQVHYRTAAEAATGGLQFQSIDANGVATPLHNISFAPTGGWQQWRTTTKSLELPRGVQHVRLLITAPSFNLNWFSFDLLVALGLDPQAAANPLTVYPNPHSGVFTLRTQIQETAVLSVVNLWGQVVHTQTLLPAAPDELTLDISRQPDGYYFVLLRTADGLHRSVPLLKQTR
ncbi:MAG: hypothetical protein OHK0039_13080 [Bacteroidia bacterium]